MEAVHDPTFSGSLPHHFFQWLSGYSFTEEGPSPALEKLMQDHPDLFKSLTSPEQLVATLLDEVRKHDPDFQLPEAAPAAAASEQEDPKALVHASQLSLLAMAATHRLETDQLEEVAQALAALAAQEPDALQKAEQTKLQLVTGVAGFEPEAWSDLKEKVESCLDSKAAFEALRVEHEDLLNKF